MTENKRFPTLTKHSIIYVDTGKKPTREDIIKQMMCQEPLINDEEAFLRQFNKEVRE